MTRFKRNITAMVSANAVAQAIPLLVSPALTRLYRPEDFAALALFSAILGVAQVVATMRMDWLVTSAEDDAQARLLLRAGMLHVTGASALAAIVVLSGEFLGTAWATRGLVGNYIWLLPIAIMGAGLQVILASWFVREAELTPVASTRIRQSLTSAVVQLSGGLISAGAWGLILGVIGQSWTGVVGLGRTASRRAGAIFGGMPLHTFAPLLREVGRRYVVTGLTGVMNVSGLMIPPIMVAAFYSPTELGWFSLAQRLALGPVGILTAAVSHSFWAEARNLAESDPRELWRLYRRTAGRLALVAAGTGGMCAFGPVFVGPLFGADAWEGAGPILFALAPAVMSQVVASTLAPILAVYRQEAWLLIWDACRTAAIVVGFPVARAAGLGIRGAVIVFSLTTAGMYAVLFLKQWRLLKSQAYGTSLGKPLADEG